MPSVRLSSTSVHALDAGWFTMPERFFLHPVDDERRKKLVPSLAFLIQHRSADSERPQRILFDLGLRRDILQYSKPIQEHLITRQPLYTSSSVEESLAQGGLSPGDVDMVILSHLHWDHVGTPSAFERSLFIIGSGGVELLRGVKAGGSSHNHFEPGLLPWQRIVELPAPGTARSGPSAAQELRGRAWAPFGPFDQTLDMFGDGSIHVVWAPGHLSGHINLLVRKDDGTYVYLAGDAAHDMRLLLGEKDIATWQDDRHPGQVCCIHQDKVVAKQTLARIREAMSGTSDLGQCEVVLAHDEIWAAQAIADERFLPGCM
ncbi:beta-lactamase-like protein [Microdochium bolleyi]|uniref:Beta-lactamase-like protein n=1 Tax=Microdochium bolleyi TaxID=196109 RepID=A0A136IUS1_9PEZI|nr:beta-lactamase-like protein [Microdochium bolleyi]